VRRHSARRVDGERLADQILGVRVQLVPAIRVDELELDVGQRVGHLSVFVDDVAVAGEHRHDQFLFRWKVDYPWTQYARAAAIVTFKSVNWTSDHHTVRDVTESEPAINQEPHQVQN